MDAKCPKLTTRWVMMGRVSFWLYQEKLIWD